MPTAVTVGLVVRLEAKPEAAGELASLLASAGPLAEAEQGTPVWLGLRTSDTTFWVVDAFPTDVERQAHFGGEIAAALMGNADRLLAEPPEMLPADVLAAKIAS